MAEHDTTEDQDNDTQLVRDLRRQIKQANKELGELRSYRTERLLQKAGFDPDSKDAKKLLKLHGDDGELTVEALQATAAEWDLTPSEGTDGTTPTEPVDEVAQQRVEATQRIDDLRANAQPVGTVKTSWQDYQQMKAADPSAAAAALAAGQVELPAYVASALDTNRAVRANQIGA